MMKLVVACIAGCLLSGVMNANSQENALAARCAELSKDSSMAVAGSDGWYFLKSELRHLSVGDFWGEKSLQTSRASNSAQKDPLKAIVAYKEALDKEGIDLLLVPIPPKAVVYPDKLDPSLSVKRYDASLQAFYKVLEQYGVSVLDLTSQLMSARKASGEPLYCKGDSHLSGEGCKVVAEAIARNVNVKGNKNYTVKSVRISFKGDLYKSLPEVPNDEQRTIYVVSGAETKDKNSEVILMGDSHTLVFDAGGDMFAQNAGIASLLAATLKMPVDVIGVRGSGATPARVNLYRRSKSDPQYIKNKKVLVWCFTAREFTEASAWNSAVPIK